MAYLPRVVDDTLREMLGGTRAIAIEGPRAVGKTASAARVAASVVGLDDPDTRMIVSADRRRYLAGLDSPVLVDEWQRDPPVWDAVRRIVDDDPQPGRFVLTGSANPRDTHIHSGAGRFIRLRMRPLSFAERHPGMATVSLRDIWEGGDEISGRSDVTLADYAREIVDSGFPGIRAEPPTVRRRAVADYVSHALEHEVPELGGVRRRPRSLHEWLRAYAAATSTTATFEAIAAAVDRAQPPSRTTINDFRDVLQRLWLLDEVPAWNPGTIRLNRLGRVPKHHLADPALAAALLQLSAGRLIEGRSLGGAQDSLRDGPLFSTFFESLVVQSVRTYAAALELEVSHLRMHRGEREIDLVLHAGDGRAIAIEVKLGQAADDHDVRHLNWLSEQMDEDLVARIVGTTGPAAYRRGDGVAVVPLSLLGP